MTCIPEVTAGTPGQIVVNNGAGQTGKSVYT